MEDTCKFPHNSDLYGIGIRVGLYCQWLTSLASQIYVPAEAPATQATSQLFQTAVLISLVILTATRSIYQPEVIIVLSLSFGGFLTSHHLPDLVNDQASIPRRAVAVINFGAFVAYCCWFWSRGAQKLQEQHPDCVFVTMLFGRWKIIALRTFGIVMSSIGCFVFLVVAAAYTRRVSVLVAQDGVKTSLRYLIPVTGAPGVATRDSKPRWQTWLQITVALLAQSNVIAMVELTLRWNPQQDYQTVLAAGQMIPLVIGVSGLVRILYLVLTSQLRVRLGIS
ncbi:hypothetical protein FMUND_5681 [Fusarium mundagurra]|uniref:Uncharacterized protein n=1 Tax=Fusarium mundagurra TaxID=1567541 RepID=A0A8H5YRQ7_9HYPO|nr:hypothetical protein FMUND_5681 [Fusarium mundagurra]